MKAILLRRSVFLSAVTMGAVLFALKWMEWKYVLMSYTAEVFIGLTAVLFTGVGVWLSLSLMRPKTREVIVYKAPSPDMLPKAEEAITGGAGLSRRETEVLGLLAVGLSNEEIARRLFVSLSTVKTHIANIFAKLDVKRRTQAVRKAKELRLID